MIRKGTVLFVTVETPLHAGTGAELGIVDLPIQRERHTGWPKVEASGLKGALREEVNLPDELKDVIFGPEKGDLHSGALVLTDLRILLFPVKSVKGTFAWIVSPEVFKRFRRDFRALTAFDKNIESVFNTLPQSLEENTVHNESELTVDINGKPHALLEEYSFEVTKGSKGIGEFSKWLQEQVFKQNDLRHQDIPKRLCVVSDDMFNDFVTMFTEITTRTRIDPKTGTVQTGTLWNEEYLPTETIMYSLMMSTPLLIKNKKERSELSKIVNDDPQKESENVLKVVIGQLDKGEQVLPRYLFLGGNETIGKGLVSLKVIWQGG